MSFAIYYKSIHSSYDLSSLQARIINLSSISTSKELSIRARVEFLEEAYHIPIEWDRTKSFFDIELSQPPFIDYLKALPHYLLDYLIHFTITTELLDSKNNILATQHDLIDNPWFDKTSDQAIQLNYHGKMNLRKNLPNPSFYAKMFVEASKEALGSVTDFHLNSYGPSVSIDTQEQLGLAFLNFHEDFIWLQMHTYDMNYPEFEIIKIKTNKAQYPDYFVAMEPEGHGFLTRILSFGACNKHTFVETLRTFQELRVS